MKRIVLSVLMLSIGLVNVQAQKVSKDDSSREHFVYATIAFWNLENLFDTINDPLKNDDDFTEEGSYKWTNDRYKLKLKNMSDIIEKMGDEDGPEILGVCEVENIKVLEDLIATPKLANKRYKIVHFDSPDRRGIDVGLIYKSNYFKPLCSTTISVKDDKDSNFITRDILLVTGVLSNDTISFMVNHWPSRRGGGSDDKRILAAIVARKQVDSLMKINEKAKIILMGDFNDNPNDKSIITSLRGKPLKKILDSSDLFNPMFDMYKNGIGTLAHQDIWALFDQIILSQTLVNNPNSKYFYKTGSSSPYVQKVQVQEGGRYSGHPFRTYSGTDFTNGYSDHFPVYLYLVQKIN